MVFFRAHRFIPAAALLLAGGLALGPPARATTLRRVEVTCPVDGEKFFARAVMSTNSVGTDRDLFRRTSGLHAGRVIIWTCPGNFYSGYAKDFRIRLGDNLKRRIREELRPLIKGVPPAALPAWARYASLCGMTSGVRWHVPLVPVCVDQRRRRDLDQSFGTRLDVDELRAAGRLERRAVWWMSDGL